MADNKKVKRNRLRCLHCHDVVESHSRHDFKTCKCGKVFVDGGTECPRLGFPGGLIEDHIQVLEDAEDE